MQSYLQYRRLRREVESDLRIIQRDLPSTPLRTRRTDSSPLGPDLESPSNDTLTNYAPRTDPLAVPGVTLREPEEKDSNSIFIVGWKENDPHSPYQWSLTKRWVVILMGCMVAMAITLVSSIEGPTLEAFDEHYHVGPLAGSTATTGIFLIGVGFGSLFSGPFSETFGRNIVYFITLTLVIAFTVGKALAPNYAAALIFRFISALFAATPMTVFGGSVGDIWTPREMSFALPFAFMFAYIGPLVGPIIGAYTPEIGFRWADWISIIIVGAVLLLILLFQPETYGPTLLEWRAKHLRELTGDDRYRTAHELSGSLGSRLLTNLSRPFTMVWTEPIILVFSFYLVLLYFVLFTFLNGYTYIFTIPYGISNGLTFILWTAMLPGVLLAILLIPYINHLTKKAAARSEAKGQPMQPEVSLYWSMAGGSVLMPISLFWMAWTCYSSISIWSPIMASFLFGYSLICIFTTAYMYIILVYVDVAASALGFMTFSRYIIAGALTPASVQMYEKIGPHWGLTVSAVAATVMAPVPFVLARYGHKVRAMSKNAQNKG